MDSPLKKVDKFYDKDAMKNQWFDYYAQIRSPSTLVEIDPNQGKEFDSDGEEIVQESLPPLNMIGFFAVADDDKGEAKKVYMVKKLQKMLMMISMMLLVHSLVCVFTIFFCLMMICWYLRP